MCILRVCIAVCDHCAANVAALGGGVNRNACAFCECSVCVCAFATCDHCAANVAAFGGRSKPERLCAFCVCALLLVTAALLMLPHWVGGVKRNACVHFACAVRFTCAHCCL